MKQIVKSKIARLEKLLKGTVVITDPDIMIKYGKDESNITEVYLPDAVVLAENKNDVIKTLRWSYESEIPVTPRGTGTGMTGGALPVKGGVVISLEKMNKIKEIDRENLIAIAEPGIITGQFQEIIENEGLFYPPDPASLADCSLGGNVAENAGGPRAFKYGVTGHYVIGLDVVFPEGHSDFIGRKTVKGVTGYNLVGIITGSEGTLAIITEIVTRLIPKPQAVETALAFFNDPIKAGKTVSTLVAKGILTRTLEYMDKNSMDSVRAKAEVPIPQNVESALLIEVDGDDESLLNQIQIIAEVCEANGAFDIQIAQNEAKRRKIWTARRLISSSLKEFKKFKIAEDIVVPRTHIPTMIAFFKELGQKYNLYTAAFGHAGDGNLHLNVVYDYNSETLIVKKIFDEIFKKTIELGGTLSGEHGIGIAKNSYLNLEQSSEIINMQKKLKKLFDPKNLLNPGKIFP